MPANYTVKQVSELLGYSTNSIYTFLKEKRLKGVRVGKGRFRIPQSEVNKFLNISEPPLLVQPIVPVSTVPAIVQADTFVDPSTHVEVPSIFDWFVGVGSIILGAAWMLLVDSPSEFPVQMHLLWIPMLRSVLIAAGIGLLVADISGIHARLWRRVFKAILLGAFASLSGSLLWYGSVSSGLIYAVVTTMFAASVIWKKQTVLLFFLYILFASSIVSYPMLVNALGLPLTVAALLLVSSIGLYGFVRHYAAFLHAALLLSCTSLVYAAVSATNATHWSYGLFLLFSALLSIFIPSWSTFAFIHKQDRSFVFRVIGSLLFIFVFTTGVVRLMQSAILTRYSREIEDKVSFSKISVEKSFGLAEEFILSLSRNKYVIESFEKDSFSTILDMSKNVVSNSSFIRSLLFVSTDGEVKSVYPYDINRRSSLASLPSISQAIASKRMVVLEELIPGFETGTKKEIVIAAPILNSTSTVLGVVLGTLDMDSIVSDLQQVTAESQGEYVRIADESGRVLFSPSLTPGASINTDYDPLRNLSSDTQGRAIRFSEAGSLILAAVDRIQTSIPLTVSIHTPYSIILQMGDTSPFIMLFLLLMSSASIALFFISHRKKWIHLKDSGGHTVVTRRENTS